MCEQQMNMILDYFKIMIFKNQPIESCAALTETVRSQKKKKKKKPAIKKAVGPSVFCRGTLFTVFTVFFLLCRFHP
uniref:Uncharacterized protein n=1 Tax=Anguilla anguilla TaxID=7936 RepID=A0A0E9R2Q0_ANGAN